MEDRGCAQKRACIQAQSSQDSELWQEMAKADKATAMAVWDGWHGGRGDAYIFWMSFEFGCKLGGIRRSFDTPRQVVVAKDPRPHGVPHGNHSQAYGQLRQQEHHA